MRVSDIKLLSDRNYDYCGSIGQGAYSKVKLFRSNKLKTQVAVKIINKSHAPRDFVKNFLPREINILQIVKHSNIIDIYEILATNDGRIFIISEYAGYGDLLHHIQNRGALSEDRALLLFVQLASAIGYLHEKCIVHRDLKCENLLLTTTSPAAYTPDIPSQTSSSSIGANNSYTEPIARKLTPEQLSGDFNIETTKLVLADFGFSRNFSDEHEKSRTFCGSAAYAAPEIIKGEPYFLKNHDMWSLGVILFIMVCGTMPYDDSNVRQMLKDQMTKRLRFPPQTLYTITTACLDLIQKLIEPDVVKRYSVTQVMNHAWVTHLNDETNRMQQKKRGQWW